ncbi:MAG: hypothetical protein K1000chlam3_00865 [Chlamydiae bacterium]|nr:hypothetical protein [Chlamydiota bacterium]
MLLFFQKIVNMPKTASKKHSFVLLEILIAFALVSIAILPFFRYPFQHMQKELSTLFEMELERIAQNKLTELHTQLFQKSIAEQLIFADGRQTKPIETNRISVDLAPNFTRTYEEKVFVTWERQKLSNDRIMTALVHFKLQYRKPNKRWIILQAESKAVAQKKI